MKKIIYCLLILFTLCSLISCDNGPEAKLTPSAEVVYDKTTGERSISGKDVLDYGTWAPSKTYPTLIPWQADVSALAKADKTLRFYFMASEGTQVSGVGEKIGDCCLVVFPNGQTMLIDACSAAGDPGYIPMLVKNLKRLGVSTIDYLVITHQHSDHYQGFTVSGGIADNFTIGKVYYNGLTGHSGYTTIKNTAEAHSIPFEVLQEGDVLNIGGVKIEILNPIKGATTETYENVTEGVNNSSITMMISYGSIKALFTGDLYKSGMQAVVSRYGSKLNSDILKIPHHGHSDTSILDSFAKNVTPKVAIASSGIALDDNVYNLYKKYGADVIGDYNEGYVIVSTNGTKIYTKTSRVKDTDYYDVYDQYYASK